MAKIPLSIQLYTLRDLTATDLPGVLRQLKQIGYAGVELAGYGNLKTAADVRKAVADAGLVISGSHVGIDGLLTDPGKFADEQHALGNVHVICPWAPLDGKSEADYAEFARKLDQAGKAAQEHGLVLAYHNHSFEHKPLRRGSDGKWIDGLDVIYGTASPEYVKAEIDVFWTQHGGHNPARYVEKLGSRCILLHLKDMEVGPDRRFANVGDGILDFPAIIAAGQKVGVRWYVVEQDNCYGQNPLDAARNSFENLKKMGYV
ncbi:MAG: sugar phosphate isomerase/epimerase family protein [Tepidisphaerales bacterium]